MHRKLLNSNLFECLFFFCFFFWTMAEENLWAPIQCWLIGLYIWLVSYFLFESYIFIYQLWMLHGFRFFCFTFCLQKIAWIREFLLKFTNFKMKINLISIIYKIFVWSVCLFGSYFGLWLSLGFWILQMQICTTSRFFPPNLHAPCTPRYRFYFFFMIEFNFIGLFNLSLLDFCTCLF